MIDEIVQMYSGEREKFSWVGFGSGSGTNLMACSNIIKPALLFSDRPKAAFLQRPEFEGIPKYVLNGYKQCGSWKKAQGNDALERAYRDKSLEFNCDIRDFLLDFEDRQEKHIDLIILGGYMRLVMEPLLEQYSDRIINVHPADLSILEDSKRKFVGDNAVYDAIKSGKLSTKSSVILVDYGVDHGEIITQGPELEVWREYCHGSEKEKEETLAEYSQVHQSMQKVRSDWPALTTALELIADGRIALGQEKWFGNEWRQVHLDGNPLPYKGHQVK